jgi:membrane protein YdbS with pleckstrin-like domain
MENVMKPNRVKSTTKMVANVLILAFVLVGPAVFGIVNNDGGGEIMSKLFLAFFGAIVTIQMIPGLLLLGAILKGVFGLVGKNEA